MGLFAQVVEEIFRKTHSLGESVENEINNIFDEAIKEMIKRTYDIDVRDALEEELGNDWYGMVLHVISRTFPGVHRASFNDLAYDVVHELFSDYNPFKSYEANKGSALRTWVMNNLFWAANSLKRKNRVGGRSSLRQVELPDQIAAFKVAGEDLDDVIESFRQFVYDRLGKTGRDVLDSKLAGERGAEIIGSRGRRLSKQRISTINRQIKDLLKEYFADSPEILRQIDRIVNRKGTLDVGDQDIDEGFVWFVSRIFG